jgi:solute carrier family 35
MTAKLDDGPLGTPLLGSSMDKSRPSTPQHSQHRAMHSPSTGTLHRSIIVSLAACSFYIVVSASMVFVNKALTYMYGFRSTNVLLFLQMIFTIFLLRTARTLGIIELKPFERKRALTVAPVSVFYSLNAAVALVALRELSVPSYTFIKRMSPLFTLGLEFFLLGKRPSLQITASLVVMVSGTVLAANSDATSSLYAWSLGIVSCILQATYLAYVKRSSVEMSALSILYYHSILSLPCITAIVLAVGEIGEVMAYDKWANLSFGIVLCLSLSMGLLLNYALFLCTELTSPTSTVVSGQVKAIAQTLIGMVTFGGQDMNAKYVTGTALNVCGGLGYSWSKYNVLRQSQ